MMVLTLFHNHVDGDNTVYPKKYAHGFVVLCFLVVMQSFIMNSHEVFIHIHQGCFAGIGAIVRLPQWQWSKLDGYGKISQCITTTKHSKAKTVCIFLWIYCKCVIRWFSVKGINIIRIGVVTIIYISWNLEVTILFQILVSDDENDDNDNNWTMQGYDDNGDDVGGDDEYGRWWWWLWWW